MKQTISGVALGLLSFVLACELLFRALPVSGATKADYYIDPRILTYVPNLESRSSMGWDLRHAQPLRTNNYGFVSAHAFVRDESAVALIGDSYVEASSLPPADRPEAQLERALGGRRPVYAMGAAGTAPLDYAERIRFAHEVFGIRDFVVLLERSDSRQALCGSGNVHSQCLDPATLAARTEQLPAASAAKRLLRESALAQYLVSQLKIVPGKLLRQAFTPTVPGAAAAPATAQAPRAPGPTPAVDAVARAFFERVKPHVQGRLVIVVDADRAALMRGESRADPERSRFIELARAAGASVVDTEPLFRAHYQRSPLSLDVAPNDGHFNPLGVALLAARVAQELAP